MTLEEEVDMRYREMQKRCGIEAPKLGPGDYDIPEEEEEEEGISMGDVDAYGYRPELVGNGVKFERIRRITGYLVGDVSRWNDGKYAELKDRVKHG